MNRHDHSDASFAESSTPDSQQRIALFRRAFETFFRTAPTNIPEGGTDPFLIFQQVGYPDHFVQFSLACDDSDGEEVYGEVGSREWPGSRAPHRPLSPVARAFLAAYGFTGGGAGANFGRRGLPRTPAWLAGLTEALFSVYEPAPGFRVLVTSSVPEVVQAVRRARRRHPDRRGASLHGEGSQLEA